MSQHFLIALAFTLSCSWVCDAQKTDTFRVAQGSSSPARVLDLVLDAHNGFSGMILNRQGNLVPGTLVELYNKRGVVARQHCDARGTFSFRDVEAGPLVIRANNSSQSVRIWEQKLAPPAARSSLLLVCGDGLIRGQACDDGQCDAYFANILHRTLQNPWLVGVGTAAAIAIPIAAGDDDDDDRAAARVSSTQSVTTDIDTGAGETPDAS